MLFVYKSLPFLLLFTLMGCNSNFFDWLDGLNEDDEVIICDDDTSVTFKTVAYWSPYDPDDNDDTDDYLAEVDFEALTHIIYASISVNADGSLNFDDDNNTEILEDIVDYAQAACIKVGVSLGDGNDNNFNSIASSADLTDDFVDNVMDFIDEYELDGVDINWQSIDDDDESDNLETLLDELEEELADEDHFLSMTLPSGEDSSADNIDNAMFAYIDFANVMAFDLSDGSDLYYTLEDATESIDYWTEHCLIQNKLVLGVPFYSGGSNSTSRSFNYIVNDDAEYACTDESRSRYYNGIPTIIDKTLYAVNYAGGMMIKSLEQDAYEDSYYSLLNVINKTITDEDDDNSVLAICDE